MELWQAAAIVGLMSLLVLGIVLWGRRRR